MMRSSWVSSVRRPRSAPVDQPLGLAGKTDRSNSLFARRTNAEGLADCRIVAAAARPQSLILAAGRESFHDSGKWHNERASTAEGTQSLADCRYLLERQST